MNHQQLTGRDLDEAVFRVIAPCVSADLAHKLVSKGHPSFAAYSSDIGTLPEMLAKLPARFDINRCGNVIAKARVAYVGLVSAFGSTINEAVARLLVAIDEAKRKS